MPETALLLNSCYQPTQWDIYWRLEPCDFVMRKIEREQRLFGTPAITEAWMHAVMRHPVAYLQHRVAFMWNFLAGDNLTMWLADVEHPIADRSFPIGGLSSRWSRFTTPSSRRRCFASVLGCWFASSCAASPGGGAGRVRAPSSWAYADRPRSMCEFLRRRRRLRFPLWLLGGAGRHRRHGVVAIRRRAPRSTGYCERAALIA